MARGKSRSDSIENIIQNAKTIARKGIKEIVLTGVNLGDFSLPNPSKEGAKATFLDLVKSLENVEGIERYRISSIEPNLLSYDIIEFVAQSKTFMPHFHIPLQSGSNKILGLMRRRYKKELYAEKVQHIKSLIPHCAIGVDVIVGFPSESDDDFKKTVDFIQNLDVSYLHVFTYSERDNTKALDIQPAVPISIRHERNKTLRNLSFMKMQYFNQQHTGQTRKVLFENYHKNGMMEGYTDNYIKIVAPYKKDWTNRILDWTI